LKPSKDEQKKNSMLQRLSPIASTLLSYVKSNSKNVVKATDAIQQIVQSHPDYYLTKGWLCIIIDQIFEHLRLLSEIAPRFCKLELLINCNNVVNPNADHYLVRFQTGSRLQIVTDAVQKK
jgi:hypothetical protein